MPEHGKIVVGVLHVVFKLLSFFRDPLDSFYIQFDRNGFFKIASLSVLRVVFSHTAFPVVVSNSSALHHQVVKRAY